MGGGGETVSLELNISDEIVISLQLSPNPAVLISSIRSFINIENSEGERMQPCLTPS